MQVEATQGFGGCEVFPLLMASVILQRHICLQFGPEDGKTVSAAVFLRYATSMLTVSCVVLIFQCAEVDHNVIVYHRDHRGIREVTVNSTVTKLTDLLKVICPLPTMATQRKTEYK